MKHDRTVETLLDTGRANEYMYAYLEIALKESQTDENAAESIREGLRYALDMFTASEALEGYR